MDNSILITIKKMLGITEDYTQFDMDLIIHINSIISILTQLGVGPSTGFSIVDITTTWSEWEGVQDNLESIKTYIYLRVRLLFDPPTNFAVTKSYEQIIRELEWRVYTTIDNTIEDITIIVEEDEYE